jgi:hypothetical protein
MPRCWEFPGIRICPRSANSGQVKFGLGRIQTALHPLIRQEAAGSKREAVAIWIPNGPWESLCMKMSVWPVLSNQTASARKDLKLSNARVCCIAATETTQDLLYSRKHFFVGETVKGGTQTGIEATGQGYFVRIFCVA